MNNIELMYQELIEREGVITGNNISYSGSNYAYDDDVEEVLTSKEIVKTKEELEKKYGVADTGQEYIDESIHFKRYTKRREHKYTESEMAKIKESCESTIVHDYSENDIYHISDEERANNDMLAELSMKLAGLKRTYRKVDQYIEAMRVVVQAWELLEKNNYVHTTEEFFKMVAKGKIVSNRIIMPKLKKMDSYNMDMIVKYISNPELDPTDLAPEKPEEYDEWYGQFDDVEIESDEEKMERLLDPDEVQWILDHADNPPTIKVNDIKRKYIKGYDRRDFNTRRKKLKKRERYFVDGLHEILNKIQSNPANRGTDGYSRSFLVTNSMFDTDKPEKDFWDSLYFDGSWASKTDVFLYDLAIREELLKQHPTNERYLTYGDRELQQFFRILEDHGVNTIDLRRKMNCSVEQLSKMEQTRSKKDNKKIESSLIQRIMKLNDNPKFKKLAAKAEDALNKSYGEM